MPTLPSRYRHNTAAVPTRGTRHERGYNSKWSKASASYIREHPFCVGHDGRGTHTMGCNGLATTTDHIVRVHGQADPMFWDVSNWQALSVACHSRKTATE